MSELTPKERVMRLLRKEPIDTMPFFQRHGHGRNAGHRKSRREFCQCTYGCRTHGHVGDLVRETDGF